MKVCGADDDPTAAAPQHRAEHQRRPQAPQHKSEMRTATGLPLFPGSPFQEHRNKAMGKSPTRKTAFLLSGVRVAAVATAAGSLRPSWTAHAIRWMVDDHNSITKTTELRRDAGVHAPNQRSLARGPMLLVRELSISPPRRSVKCASFLDAALVFKRPPLQYSFACIRKMSHRRP